MNQPQTIQVSDKEYQALVKRVERLEKIMNAQVPLVNDSESEVRATRPEKGN